MPELPEVETVKTYVCKKVLNKKIKNIKVLDKKLRWPIDSKKIGDTRGKTIKQVTRRGKYILLQFDEPTLTIVIHLGMTGIIYFRKTNEYKKRKHDHFLMYFDEHVLVYNDVRKFGSIHVTNEISNMFLLQGLGPEPMSGEFNKDYLFDIADRRTCSVKELIMNQKIVVGIGNIYASEALFLSKIHPASSANKISKKQYEKLIKNIKVVLSKAISMGGSTIKDFVNAEGKPGYFTQELLVYKKEYCPIHKKNLISNIKISGRSSFFCDKCQKL